MKKIHNYLFIFFLLTYTNARGQQTILLSEDFETTLNPLLISQTTGAFTTYPGIRIFSGFGSSHAFGFGFSVCAGSCFNLFTSDLSIAFTTPTYIDSLKFSEMEVSGNWGSQGEIYLDGNPLSGGIIPGAQPYNSFVADTVPRYHEYSIKQTVTNITFHIHDITYSSEIVLDDLIITTVCDIVVLNQPVNQTMIAGSTAIFATEASVPAATYQWQTDTGSGFQDVVNGGQYSGATDDTLIVTNISAVNDNQIFRCLITHNGCSVTTNTAGIILSTGIFSVSLNAPEVYPNLFSDRLQIFSSTDQQLTITLYNLYGIKKFENVFQGNTTFDCTQLPPSIYLYKIIMGSSIISEGKLIKF